MKTLKYLIFLSVLLLIVVSCARIVTPKGGGVDVTAPEVLSCQPANNSVNFKGKSFRINFDEYIVLDNANAKLIVSPPLKNKPTVTSNLKSLVVKDLDSLAENTTYIFDFSDAVGDYTENNKVSSLIYSFSTGAEIDTFAYHGRLLNAVNLQKIQGVYVALYKNNDVKYIHNNLPDYITRSGKDGVFHLKNIKDGKYTVIAFKDENQNMIYDLQNEGFGFKHNIIVSGDKDISTGFDTIYFADAQDTVFKVLSSKVLNNKQFQIICNNPANDRFRIDFSKPEISECDTLIVRNQTSDTLNIFLKSEKIFDTLYAKMYYDTSLLEKTEFETSKSRFSIPKTSKTFSFSMYGDTVRYFDKLELKIPYPLKMNENENIKAMILADNDTIFTNFYVKQDKSLLLTSDFQLQENKNYTILIDSAVCENFMLQTNVKFERKIATDDADTYGRFIFSLKDSLNSGNDLIISLYDSKQKVVSTKKVSHSIVNEPVVFNNLKQDDYTLRIVIDKNSDGKWTAGDFDSNIPHEKTIIFPKTITIKPGWDTAEEYTLPLR